MASLLSIAVLLCLAAAAAAQLSTTFYDTSCPNALPTIKSAVTAAVNNEARMGASLLRLHFHDCFVHAIGLSELLASTGHGLVTDLLTQQGCDASVLLADTATFTGEQNAPPNKNSLRGFNVIEGIKTQLEGMCKQTVSCADILAVAARDSVVALGGPSWKVGLGRRDSTTASMSLAISDLPPPFLDLEQLISAFGNKGFTTTDMVALSACASSLSLTVLVAAMMASAATAQLSATFYDTSCPNALSTIRSVVTAAVNNESRMGASLLRLHFHDCFVDASLSSHGCFTPAAAFPLQFFNSSIPAGL
ncbi:hypothetical protein ABZP36_000695 [Zizania latifolia]